MMRGTCAPSSKGRRLSRILILTTIALLAVLLRFHTLDRITLDWDEDLYRAYAQDLQAGKVLYRDLWDHKPPGIFYLFALLQGIHPSVEFFRAAAIVWGIGCGLAIFAIAAVLWSFQAGCIAFLSWTLVTSTDWGTAANSELFLTLFTLVACLSFAFILRGTVDGAERPARRFRILALLAGAASGIAFQFKPVAAADFAAILTAAILLGRTGWRPAPPRKWRDVPAGMLAGFLLPNLAALAWSFYYGVTAEWFYAAYVYNWQYVSEPMFEVLSYGPRNLREILLSQAPFFLAAAAGMMALRRERAPVGWFFVLWTVMAFLSVSLGLKFLKHYFVQWVAPLSLLTGLAFHAAVPGLRDWVGRLIGVPGKRWSAGVAGLLIALLWMGWGAGTAFARGADLADAVNRWEYGVRPPDTSLQIAKMLQRSFPGLSVYVWRSPYLGVYFLSGSRPATRFLFWRHLTRTPLVDWIEKEWEESMLREPPTLILNSDRGPMEAPSARFMEAMLDRHYAAVYRSSRFTLYRLMPEDLAERSLTEPGK